MMLAKALVLLLVPSASAGWVETINQAGLQRTLSQRMTKEFLLISRGTKVGENKDTRLCLIEVILFSFWPF